MNATPPQPIIIKLGGDAIDSPVLPDLCRALAQVHAHVPLIVVHGGGKGVDRQLDRLGLTSQRREGLRITPPEHMDQVTAVLAGLINTTLVGAFTSLRVPAVGLTLGDGLTSTAAPVRLAFDPGRVGDVLTGEPRLLRTLLAAGFLPVIACIGLDAAGQTLNVNADHAARAVARIVGASQLLLLTDVPGIRGHDGAVVPTASADDVERLIARNVITGGMIPKARAALDAAAGAGIPATIASWKNPGDLLALTTGQPPGTRILPPSGMNAQTPGSRPGTTVLRR